MKRTIAATMIAGALLAGCATPLAGPRATAVPPTQMPSATPTDIPTATPTATPIPPTATPEILYSASAFAFHDFDGDGEYDADIGEYPLADVAVTIAHFQCTTANDGKCTLEGIPAGENHDVDVSPADSRFTHLLPSVDEGIELGSGPELTMPSITTDTTLSVPLAHGRMVLPVPQGNDYRVVSWYDRDQRHGRVANWLGQEDEAVEWEGVSVLYSRSIRVEDGHYAVDWVYDGPVLACDAGEVVGIEKDTRQSDPNDHIVKIRTEEGITLGYGHVNPAAELYIGQTLSRGQVIGYTCSHFAFDIPDAHIVHVGFLPRGCTEHSCKLDPYPDLWTSENPDRARVGLD